jgi:hypothetical protein
MTLNKYNEVMEHVQVTEDMRSRILNNIGEGVKEQPKNVIVFPKTRLVAMISVVAAVCILLIVQPWQNSISQKQPDDTLSVPFHITEATSKEELSSLVNFSVEELKELPFQITEKRYAAYGDDMAEITYLGEQQQLSFRKSVGTEDNSGDYETYSLDKKVAVEGVDVTLKGEENKISLAVWTKDGYAYSMRVSEGITEQEMIAMIKAYAK